MGRKRSISLPAWREFAQYAATRNGVSMELCNPKPEFSPYICGNWEEFGELRWGRLWIRGHEKVEGG